MLIEGKDFYYNEEGLMVFTALYHLQKGYCCGNGCKHCPYNYEKVPEPKRTELLTAKQNEKF
jgi:hypothetical protein